MPQAPSPSEIAQIAQSLLVGLKRRPLALPAMIAAKLFADAATTPPAIVALTLAGQHSRFQRVAAPAPDALKHDAQSRHDDPRSMLSNASRRDLKHLLSMMKGLDGPAFFNACLDEIERHQLRLHPFDLPGLQQFLQQPATRRHPAVLPCLPGADAVSEISVEELSDMKPEIRRAVLRRFREADPASARERIEVLFASETAEQRAELLEILEHRLGRDDHEFLIRASKDRAGTVKDLARWLLGHLPGVAEYEARLSAAVAALSVKAGRKLQRKRKLVLNAKMITGRMRWDQTNTTRSALLGLLPSDLARQLDLTEDDLFELLPESEMQIIVTLAQTAASRGNRRQLEILLPLLADGAAIKLFVNGTLHTPISDDCRKILTAHFAAIITSSTLPDGATLLSIYKHARAPLGEDLARDFIRSKSWRDHVAELGKTEDAENKKTPNALAEAALLMAVPVLDEFLTSFADIPIHLAGVARAVVAFRQNLASTDPVPPIVQSQAEDRK